MKTIDRIDWHLILLLLLFFLVSIFSITSAQASGQYGENFAFKQLFWYMVGVSIIVVLIRLDSEQQLKITWFAYSAGILLLVFLHFAPESIAPVINGAKSWFVIKRVGSLQPSEIVKVLLIMALSKQLVVHHHKHQQKTWKTDCLLLTKMVLITLLPLSLIMLQPDLGTALVMLAILAGMIFVSGITWKIILPLFSTGLFTGVLIIYFILKIPEVIEHYLKVKPYQFLRIYAWVEPEKYAANAGLHLLRSLDAIGSGLLEGKGFKQGQVYIPENHTDFIFSIIGEEYGFIGAGAVICLFFLFIYHITKLALKTTIPYYTYVCAGVISMVSFHVFQNIGMTIQLLPITGIPLPFISYGGSSLIGNMFAMGIIFSIYYTNHTHMFSSH